jgi:hypothetical protein
MQYLISEQVSQNIYKNIGLCTHAYCLSRSGMQKIFKNIDILNLPDDQIPNIDAYFINCLQNENFYIIAPELFDQRWCLGTDNVPYNTLDKFMRKGQCLSEVLKITYIMSLILVYRKFIIFLLFIIFILLFSILV